MHPFFKYTWASMARSPVIRRRESKSVRRSSGSSSQRNQVAVTFGARGTVTSGVRVGLIRPPQSVSVNPSLDTPSRVSYTPRHDAAPQLLPVFLLLRVPPGGPCWRGARDEVRRRISPRHELPAWTAGRSPC